MTNKDKTSPLDALSLLVDAANAQCSNSQLAEPKGSKQAAKKRGSDAANKKAASAAAAALGFQNQRAAEMEFREALQRQALEREVQEREALMQHHQQQQQQRAAQMAGLGNWMNGGHQFSEAEYMQQLRLEALVQQRRQETLAQLALAQEYNMSPDVQGAMNMQQLQQTALLRLQELLGGGGSGGHQLLDQMGSMHGREVQSNDNPLLRLFEDRDRQQKLAAQGGPAPHSPRIQATPVQPEAVRSAPKPSTNSNVDKALSLAGGKVTVLPCRARGMPMDHNAKTAYFVLPDDIKHGAELVCSYNACRNAGTKFRYCVHCSLPVAKRNFFKRHKHTGKIPADRLVVGLQKDEDDVSSSDGESKKPIKKRVKTWNSKKLLGKLVDQKAKEINNGGKGQSKQKFVSSDEKSDLVESRKKEWDTLLGKRPRSNDEASMLKWVQNVLAVSDLSAQEGQKRPELETTKEGPGYEKAGAIVDMKKNIHEEDASSRNSVEDDAEVSSLEKNTKVKQEENGNNSDGSTSSSDGSVDLRAQKKLKSA
eukprot:scaffold24801_cov181-Cylindrotheca_fusiformis.AAC.9